MMAVSVLKKLTVAALVATLVSPVAAASAATPTAKKISVAQGKKIYDKAVKATDAWLQTTPHTTTIRTVGNSNKEVVLESRSVTIDRNGHLLLGDGVDTYLIGDTMYVKNTDPDLSDYELEIATDLGLDVNANFAIMHPSLFGEEYSLDGIRATYRIVDDQGFTGNRRGARSTTVTYRKTGTTENLTVTLQYAAEIGSPAAKRVLVTKIERGIITASSETNTYPGESYKTTTTRKAYNGTIVAPEGPYFEWDKVFLDPRYGKGNDQLRARATLDMYVREAKAYAAFEAIYIPTIKEWKLVAEDDNTVVLYDRGVEFGYSDDSTKRACGVFTDEGADLEMSTCAELGFTQL
jgi:hypothetical protein